MLHILRQKTRKVALRIEKKIVKECSFRLSVCVKIGLRYASLVLNLPLETALAPPKMNSKYGMLTD